MNWFNDRTWEGVTLEAREGTEPDCAAGGPPANAETDRATPSRRQGAVAEVDRREAHENPV